MSFLTTGNRLSLHSRVARLFEAVLLSVDAPHLLLTSVFLGGLGIVSFVVVFYLRVSLLVLGSRLLQSLHANRLARAGVRLDLLPSDTHFFLLFGEEVGGAVAVLRRAILFWGKDDGLLKVEPLLGDVEIVGTQAEALSLARGPLVLHR